MFPPMKRARVVTFAENLPAPALSEIAAAAPAAWLIDVGRGCILAANGAGRALLGLRGDGGPVLLDAAMPALTLLRSLASRPSDGDASPVRLVFWSTDGAVRPLCRITFQDHEPHALAVVVALGDGPDAPVPAAASSPQPSLVTDARLFATDDAAKLKEIARRIRDGWSSAPRPERDHAMVTDALEPTISHVTSQTEVSPSLRASLAHELRTPASAIAAAAEIMKDERFGTLGSARYVGYAADIHGSATHMLAVIERILAEAAAEADSSLHDLTFAEIDLEDALGATVSQLTPLADRAGISLSLEVPPHLPHVIADATSLRQILLNLATNAFKFTDRGGRVTFGARYRGEGPLAVVVSDTGSGMAQSDIERLLAPGRPARTERRDQSGADGLGLGLPLVRALAKANGAELAIESVPGKGTCASVIFAKDRVIPV